MCPGHCRAASFAPHPAAGSAVGAGYGLGWRRWPLTSIGVSEPGDLVWHGGAVAGYQAAVVQLPDQQRGIVVLQNAYSIFYDERLLSSAFSLAAELHDQNPDWHDPRIRASPTRRR